MHASTGAPAQNKARLKAFWDVMLMLDKSERFSIQADEDMVLINHQSGLLSGESSDMKSLSRKSRATASMKGHVGDFHIPLGELAIVWSRRSEMGSENPRSLCGSDCRCDDALRRADSVSSSRFD